MKRIDPKEVLDRLATLTSLEQGAQCTTTDLNSNLGRLVRALCEIVDERLEQFAVDLAQPVTVVAPTCDIQIPPKNLMTQHIIQADSPLQNARGEYWSEPAYDEWAAERKRRRQESMPNSFGKPFLLSAADEWYISRKQWSAARDYACPKLGITDEQRAELVDEMPGTSGYSIEGRFAPNIDPEEQPVDAVTLRQLQHEPAYVEAAKVWSAVDTPTLNIWKCTCPACPDRQPEFTMMPIAPVCYTCGDPMDRAS